MKLAFFTSSVQPRYQDDALRALAFPRNHIVTFRYRDTIVNDQIADWRISAEGNISLPFFKKNKMGVIIFADLVNNTFVFYPIRHVRLLKLWKCGTVYYAALQLLDYVHYGTGEQLEVFRKAIESIPHCPKPQDPTSTEEVPEGKFLGCINDEVYEGMFNGFSQFNEDDEWQNVAQALSGSSNLKAKLFYRIRGIFRLKGETRARFGFSGLEEIVQPASLYAESRYRLCMGTNYVLKLLTFIPPGRNVDGKLQINSSVKEAALITPEVINITSRYNEERILIGCKRMLDRTLNPITIINAGEATAPKIAEGYLLAQIEVPARLILAIVVFMVLGTVLLSVGPDMVAGVATYFGKTLLVRDATQLAVLAKSLGAIAALLGGYTAFRKLPIGK